MSALLSHPRRSARTTPMSLMRTSSSPSSSPSRILASAVLVDRAKTRPADQATSARHRTGGPLQARRSPRRRLGRRRGQKV